MADGANRHTQLPEPLRQAVVAHENGDHETAYPLYRQFVADHPAHPTALQLFGLLLSQRGAFEPAIKLMRESLHLYPEQPEVANNLGNALLHSGQIDAAIASYTQAISLLPKYVDAHRNLALGYLRAGRASEAQSQYQKALDLRPNDAPAWLGMGNAQRALGDLSGAVSCYEKALSLRDNYADAHHNLGVCLRLLHQPDRALEHYRAAREQGLDRAQLHHNIGNALVDTHERDAAIDAYRNALAREPGNPATHRNLNALLWQQQLLDDYLVSYREALAHNPDAVELRLAYAMSLNQQARHVEAEQVLREGLQRGAQRAELTSQLANTLEGQERWSEALAVHEAAVNTAGATPNHLISYARALLARGLPDAALLQAQAGAALTPYNQRALAYLGLCWRVLGDERDALLNDYARLVQVYDVPVPDGFGDTASFNRNLRDVLDPMHVARQHPAEQTVRGGSQTSGNLFDQRDPQIRALVAGLNVCVDDYIRGFPANSEHPLFARRGKRFRYAASWSVRLASSGYHTMHTHPLGWISSAYYVQVPSVVAASDTNGGGLKFGEPDIDLGEHSAARRHVQPAVGRLVLFPSYMWHGTVPFAADDARMSVAFDVVPVNE